MVVDHDYTCYGPGALFAEPSLFRGTNNRGLLIRPIVAEGKSISEIAQLVEEGYSRTEEIIQSSGLRGATILQLLLFETPPSLTMMKQFRQMERHQTYPDVSSYTAVFSTGNEFYQMLVPFYLKRILPRVLLSKALANMPQELNLSLLQSQMNQAGEKRRQQWGKIFVQTSSKGTYTFLLFCVLIFGWMAVSGTPGEDSQQLLSRFGAKVNPLIADGQYWRLLTPIFLHINFFHLLINMYSLYSLRTVEWIFGSYRFLFIFIIAGIGGNAASFLLTPSPSAGASGALFGLLGALLYFGSQKFALFRRAFNSSVWVTLGVNLLLGFTWNFVDNWAHIGGLLCGFLSAVVVGMPGDETISWKKVLSSIALIGVLFGSISYGTQVTKHSVDYHLFYANEGKQTANTSLEIMELKKALQVNPNQAERWVRLAKLQGEQKQTEDAIHSFDQALLLEPANSSIHYELGLFYEKQDLRAQAAEQYEEAIKVDPSFELAKTRLAQLEKG